MSPAAADARAHALELLFGLAAAIATDVHVVLLPKDGRRCTSVVRTCHR